MSKRNFYLVQICVSYSSPCFLPYGAGCIAAYLKHDPEIVAEYEIPQIIFMREMIEDTVKRIKEPFCVGISCFVWNYEYSKALARRIKELYPDCLIVFGGHSVAPGGEQLVELPFVDFLAHGEGEEATASLLKALVSGSDLSCVPNLSYRNSGEIVTTESYTPRDISAYPSPYLEGVFDFAFHEFPGVEFHATLETNRGCPYTCAYCEWCYTHHIRQYPIERVKAEIDWIAEHKISYCYCADANFGILERDVEIAEYVAKRHNETGFPGVFKPCYAKDSNDTVFEAGYILNSNEVDKGVTLAYQSLDKTALENIGRKNFTPEQFFDLEKRYKAVNIPTYTELILGLPGETLESFERGICELLEKGQENSMTVYDCQLYPNSPLADKEFIKEHKVGISRIPLLGIHYNPEFNGVGEFLDIITSTGTMPKDDWVEAGMFAVILQTFHHLGLLRYIALFLHNERGVSYLEFYTKLYDFIMQESSGFTHDLFAALLARRADTETADWTYQKDKFSSTGWYFEEGAFLELASNLELFKSDILPFFAGFDLDGELIEELENYQFSLIRQPDMKKATVSSKYNFYEYFEKDKPLERKPCVLDIIAQKAVGSWADYAREFVWFGKRWSATLMINPRDKAVFSEA